MSRKLTDLNPKWIGLLRPDSGEGISLDCPYCGPTHRMAAYFSNPVDGKDAAAWQTPTWEREGMEFDVLTVRPSLQYPCFHGWIERGLVFDVSESPLNVPVLNEKRQLVAAALSPLQALDVARQILATESTLFEKADQP